MKHIFKMMALLLCLVATAGMIGCTKEDTPGNNTENGGGNNGGGTQEESFPLNGTTWVDNSSDGPWTLVFYKTDGYFSRSYPSDTYTQEITYTFDNSTGRGEIKRKVGSSWQTKPFQVYWEDNVLTYLNFHFEKQ